MSNITQLETNYTIYKLYENLINSYVCDFYVEDHWKRLPKNWQSCCANLTIDQLSELLNFSSTINSKIYSLSLLCLRTIIVNNIVSRKQIPITNSFTDIETEKFKNFFWKNVKLKKRHEISVLAELCYKSAYKTNCFCIIDIGAGLGHLSRLLAYKYGFKVCTFEANELLSNSAKVLDNAFEQTLKKFDIKSKKKFKPVHISKKITKDLNVDHFLNDIRNAMDEYDKNFQFGIVGLHPCGDLGATLVRLFVESSQARFINLSSCCYMKLTLTPEPKIGFPLSKYCQTKKIILSYLSCEIACHAIENYLIKVKSNDFVQLKIHAYRAALEKILISYDPKLKHSYIYPMKYSDKLTFKDYCSKTFEKLNITIPDDIILSYTQLVNNTWYNVVVFYSIRLLFAPLIETIVLLDRTLFLQENGSVCDILPAFDCNISPRNHVIISTKK